MDRPRPLEGVRADVVRNPRGEPRGPGECIGDEMDWPIDGDVSVIESGLDVDVCRLAEGEGEKGREGEGGRKREREGEVEGEKSNCSMGSGWLKNDVSLPLTV